jgi:RNA polymerase sigma factor (sigma-70 family)
VDADKGLAQATPAPLLDQCGPPTGFVEFYRVHYREVVRTARYAGASRHEAEEAAAEAMREVLEHWARLDDPLAYARRAAVSNFLKEKTRGLNRIRRRQVERGAGTAEAAEDPNLTIWENNQWVIRMLASLPRGQRDVMALIVDGFTPPEIATLLGRTPAAIRRSLCDARRRLTETMRQEHLAEQQAGWTTHSPRKETR